MKLKVKGRGLISNGDFLGMRFNDSEFSEIISEELKKAGIDSDSKMVWGTFTFSLNVEETYLTVEGSKENEAI